MESRMEKYYREDMSTFARSKKNERLYRELSKEISEMDNLPIPDNSNEIDMAGLKKIISSRDEYRKAKELEKTFISNRPLVEDKPKQENKVYDINVLLENAKNELNRSNVVSNKRMINANFLTDLEEEVIPKNDEAIEVSEPVVEKKSISSDTDSLPLDILMDLKGNGDTVVTDPIVKEEVTMIKKIKDGETFYSGSFSFSKKDFEESEEDEDFLEENNHTGLKVFFLILGILILLGVGYMILVKYVL